MTRRRMILVLAAATALTALALTAVRARDVPKVATGFIANVLCSETFVSGLDPQRNFAETIVAMPGAGLISWAMDYRVDRARKDVTVSAVRPWPQPRGLSRRARLLSRSRRRRRRRRAAAVEKPQAALLPDIAGPSVVAPQSAAACRRARSRLRRARRAALQAHPRDRRHEGRPHHRRTLCRWHRHRHAAARLLRDQVGDLGVDRHPRPPGQAEARSARAGRSVAESG